MKIFMQTSGGWAKGIYDDIDGMPREKNSGSSGLATKPSRE
jgi:hypothetical protein